MKLFGRNPTLYIAVLNTIVVLVGTLSLRWISGPQAALIVVAINAIAAALNAYTVRPIAPAVFTYAISSILAVAASYGFALSDETVAAVNSAAIAVLGLLTYGNVSPQETPISSATGGAVDEAVPPPPDAHLDTGGA